MSLGRHFNTVKIEPSKSERKGSQKKGRLLAKLRFNQFFSSKRITNFQTAEQFFETHGRSFMPMTTIYNPQNQKSVFPAQPKFRAYKWNVEIQKDLSKFVSQNRPKKTTIRQAFHMYCKDNKQTMLKTSTLSPIPRNNSIREMKKQGKDMEDSKYSTIRSNFYSKNKEHGSVTKKNYRKRLYRDNYRQMPQKRVEDSISGWNWTGVRQDAQIQVQT